MKKSFLIALTIVIVVAAVVFGSLGVWKYSEKTGYQEARANKALTYSNLDHDIYISNDSLTTICDEELTGWKPTCGPSPAGWPMAFPYKWEVYLVESPHYYFARLVYHEYVLWWSFDYPYVAIKIPKVRTTGDWATNEIERYNNLWNITSEFEKGYNEPKCIKEPQVYSINGHYVSFGRYSCRYEKYEVVHDVEHPW